MSSNVFGRLISTRLSANFSLVNSVSPPKTSVIVPPNAETSIDLNADFSSPIYLAAPVLRAICPRVVSVLGIAITTSFFNSPFSVKYLSE